MDLARNIANAPLSKKVQDLKQLQAMYDYRLHKTEKLIGNVVIGKIKRSGVSDKVLYALMKNDIKLLEEGKSQVSTQILELEKKLDEQAEKAENAEPKFSDDSY